MFRGEQRRRKYTRKRVKCVFSVPRGALESFPLKPSSMGFEGTSKVPREAGAECGAGSDASRFVSGSYSVD